VKGRFGVILRPTRLAIAVSAALAAASVATCAFAGGASDGFAQPNDFTPQPNQIGPPPPHRTLQWDSRTGRWGLNLDMAQPSSRDVQWRDARIGLNYRLAPGVRTGVGVSLGDDVLPDPHRLDPTGPAPRVRLETTFKF
jgi:hypothetical protein